MLGPRIAFTGPCTCPVRKADLWREADYFDQPSQATHSRSTTCRGLPSPARRLCPGNQAGCPPWPMVALRQYTLSGRARRYRQRGYQQGECEPRRTPDTGQARAGRDPPRASRRRVGSNLHSSTRTVRRRRRGSPDRPEGCVCTAARGRRSGGAFQEKGGPSGDRTQDQPIMSRMLSPLS